MGSQKKKTIGFPKNKPKANFSQGYSEVNNSLCGIQKERSLIFDCLFWVCSYTYQHIFFLRSRCSRGNDTPVTCFCFVPKKYVSFRESAHTFFQLTYINSMSAVFVVYWRTMRRVEPRNREEIGQTEKSKVLITTKTLSPLRGRLVPTLFFFECPFFFLWKFLKSLVLKGGIVASARIFPKQLK